MSRMKEIATTGSTLPLNIGKLSPHTLPNDTGYLYSAKEQKSARHPSHVGIAKVNNANKGANNNEQ